MVNRIQLDSNTSAGPEFATHFSTSDSAHFPINKVAWGDDTATINLVDTGTPLPVRIQGNTDSTEPVFVLNSAGAPVYLAGDTGGTPVDDSNPFPVSVISPDTQVSVANTVTVDLGANNDVINTAATPFFIAGDTAGVPVDDTNAFPVAIIGTPTVDLGSNNDVINTAATPFFLAIDTAGTPASDSNPLPVTVQPVSDSDNGLVVFTDASSDTTAALVSGDPVRIYGYHLTNADTASFVYVHLYNDTAVSMGTDTAYMIVGLPPQGGAVKTFAMGVPFSTGLSVATTASATDTAADAPGTAAVVEIEYK